MYLSIIIPAYNEEKRISKTLFEIDNYMKNQKEDYEIIVVNDGSTDKTREVVNDLQSKIKKIIIVNNKENKGKGFVVRQGLLIAQGSLRLFTDADNATSINQLENLLPYVKDFDIVIASRAISGAVITVPQPFYRKFLGNMYRWLVKIIIGLKNIKDSQCGFKLFTEKTVNDILPRCLIDGLSFDSEILVVSQNLGYKIKEVPVTWVDQPDSKVTFSRMRKSVLDLLAIRYNLMTNRYKT